MCASHPVDNDPHFIVHLPGSNMDVCFNIDSKPGHILNLVSDRGTGTGSPHFIFTPCSHLLSPGFHLLYNPLSCPEGVVVNGQLISSKQVHNSKLSTYFGTISVDYQPDGVSVTITTDMIAMSDGSNNHSFTWAATAEITQDG